MPAAAAIIAFIFNYQHKSCQLNPSTPIQIGNCPMAFVCNKAWGDLTAQIDPTLKFCESCKKSVRLCETQAQFDECVSKGQCVAIAATDGSTAVTALIGLPANVSKPDQSEQAVLTNFEIPSFLKKD